MHRLCRLLLLLIPALLAPPPATAAAPPPGRAIPLGDCLVLPPVGRYGRTPLHLDALEAEIVAGRWRAPRPGDRLALPGRPLQSWQPATGKGGTVTHRALFGGYLYWPVRLSSPRVLLLQASGHFFVSVNGEPHTGDPYGHGFVRLPVQLRAGVNDLLFYCIHGGLTARLTAPAAPALLDTRDLTLPDLIRGEKEPVWAAAVVLNAGDRPLRAVLHASTAGAPALATPLPPIPPLSIRKVAFRVPAPAGSADTVAVELRLERSGGARPRTLDTARITLRRRSPTQSYKRTFRSGIDGSVQDYAVKPALPKPGDKGTPALVLTLHGANVDALGHVDTAYASKTWAHLVAPTNRRPFGFDWEDWGRIDALEALADARRHLRTDPRRTYLTGHSMGGHGVWHLGVTYPDRWAAIAPSAGWISLSTYPGPPPPSRPTPANAFLARAASPSNTFSLVRNCAQHGVYILHGEVDPNVRVDHARRMRRLLGEFHPDFAYHERRGAGHWYGGCTDWPPLFAFLAERARPLPRDVRQVDFVTASPGVSAWCHWAGVEAQLRQLLPSAVRLQCDPARRRFHGSTSNVARLALDLAHLAPGKPVEVELDGQKLDPLPWPSRGARLWLQRVGGKWSATGRPATALKGPHRYGPFKEAFGNEVVLVYGTHGSAAENAWSFARARFDAEVFWYRGNGSLDVVADRDFDPAAAPERNVVLYGHAESNGAWKALLGDSPMQVRRGRVEVGGKWHETGDRACLFVRPRPGSTRGLVGVVSGTSLPGMRLTERLGYFISGIGYPDCLVLAPEVLTQGSAGVSLVGFFGLDWGVASGEFAWRPEE
jgi:hypothetical protein